MDLPEYRINLGSHATEVCGHGNGAFAAKRCRRLSGRGCRQGGGGDLQQEVNVASGRGFRTWLLNLGYPLAVCGTRSFHVILILNMWDCMPLQEEEDCLFAAP